jgi:hypothetical protein
MPSDVNPRDVMEVVGKMGGLFGRLLRALADGEPHDYDDLIRAIWGDAIPPGARSRASFHQVLEVARSRITTWGYEIEATRRGRLPATYRLIRAAHAEADAGGRRASRAGSDRKPRSAQMPRKRPCLCCGAEMKSEGPHHRMCPICRHKSTGML